MHISDAIEFARCAGRTGRLIGYTAGVFDLFHQSHSTYLTACKERCDILIVGVDVDSLVRQKKGADRPRDGFNKRMANVLAHGAVDAAFAKTGSLDTFIADMAPRVYFVPDNRVLPAHRGPMLRKLGIDIQLIPYGLGVCSTTAIVQRDAQKHQQ